jgi:hypothetical protein
LDSQTNFKVASFNCSLPFKDASSLVLLWVYIQLAGMIGMLYS